MNRRRFVSSALAATFGVAGAGSAAGAAADDVAFTHEGETLSLAAARGQTVSGSSDYGEGVELTVRLRSAGSSPFIKTASTTVDADGSFEATFDLSGVPVGSEFTATASWHSIPQAETTGTVVALDPDVSLDVEGETLALSPAAEQSITGGTNLPEGESVRLVLRSQRGEVFLKQAAATVDGDGTFSATVDMSGLADGTMFLLEATYAGERRTFAIGEVTA